MFLIIFSRLPNLYFGIKRRVTMFNLKKNSSGFTLVELMVVVAIIGILSAIAVPNFKKYQAKSKQSEAKLQLAAVYSTEVAAQADYDTFSTCLLFLGYEQPPKGYYIVGFGAAAAATTAQVDTRVGTGSGCASDGFNVAPTSHIRANTVLALPATAQVTAATVVPPTTVVFTAGAAGVISASNTTAYDSWNIDQNKKVSNTIPGI
jgi:type IV pilus assembly protein PilA